MPVVHHLSEIFRKINQSITGHNHQGKIVDLLTFIAQDVSPFLLLALWRARLSDTHYTSLALIAQDASPSLLSAPWLAGLLDIQFASLTLLAHGASPFLLPALWLIGLLDILFNSPGWH